MNWAIDNIVRDVRVLLNENSETKSLISISDIETLELDEIITSKISDAARGVIRHAPNRMLENGIPFAQKINWETERGKGMGFVELPKDFLRLMVFRMSDWKRPVTDTIEDTDHRYFPQKSKFAGVRGGIEKPICAITTNQDGKIMEFYSCVGGASVSVKTALYIPYPKIINEEIDISTNLYTPTLYYLAGLVCVVLKDSEQAKSFFELSKSFLE